MSVLPPSPKERLHPRSDLTLQAVNNTPIPTFGTRSLTLNLGLRRTFRWVFILAETSTPILGADFLRHFGLLVDLKNSKLSDSTTSLAVQGVYRRKCPSVHHCCRGSQLTRVKPS